MAAVWASRHGLDYLEFRSDGTCVSLQTGQPRDVDWPSLYVLTGQSPEGQAYIMPPFSDTAVRIVRFRKAAVIRMWGKIFDYILEKDDGVVMSRKGLDITCLACAREMLGNFTLVLRTGKSGLAST